MRDDIVKYIAEDISSSYYDVLLNAYNDQQHKFPITSLVIEFVVRLKEKNLIDGLDLDLMEIHIIEQNNEGDLYAIIKTTEKV